ncbi:BgTH12-07892 [Blumeria graminis f. sp. triticale]|uniref:t-SNARE affecting a late Golgi compartment protein 1 n=1 Tax=Blumeria graminis f. sp. triticale TaxID=1689686 RepID=A0A9W4GDW5_BLUGR|nr:BgTH12-07892 [Blumeria graminis f. sp. triticale]
MMSASNEDPFIQVQADVLAQLHQTRSLYTSFLRIRSLSPSSNSPELRSAHSDLSSAIEALSEDLADLLASVQAVQSDPYKYGLEIEEVTRRKRLCDEVRGEVEKMQAQITMNTTESSNPQTRTSGNDGEADNMLDTGSDTYAVFEQQQQSQIMAEQDKQLDMVSQTVYNIRQQASDMGRELEEQAEMLDRVDGLADRVGGRMQTGLKTMGTVIKRNEDVLSSCCIAVLVFVLILLLILVLVL